MLGGGFWQLISVFSPAAEVGNPASLDKVEFLPFEQLKIFKMAAAKWGQICDGDVHFW